MVSGKIEKSFSHNFEGEYRQLWSNEIDFLSKLQQGGSYEKEKASKF